MKWWSIIKEAYKDDVKAKGTITIPLERIPETIQLQLNQVYHKQFRFKENKISLHGVFDINDKFRELVSAIHGTEHLFNVMNWKTGRVRQNWFYYRTGFDDDQWMMGDRAKDKHNRRVSRLEPPEIPDNLGDEDVMIVLEKGGWRSHAGSYRRPARIRVYINTESDFFDNLEERPLAVGLDLTNGEMMALLVVQGYYGKPKYKAFNELDIGEGSFGAENTIYQSLVEKGWVTFNPRHRRANLRNFPLLTEKARTMFDDFLPVEERIDYESENKIKQWVQDLKTKPVDDKVKMVDYKETNESE